MVSQEERNTRRFPMVGSRQNETTGMDERSAESIIAELFSEETLREIEGAVESQPVPAENPQDEITRLARTDTHRKLFGPRFLNATFDNYIVEPGNNDQWYAFQVCKTYAEKIHLMKRMERQNLILAGKSGTGKNHLAYAIAKAALAKKMGVTAIPFLHIMQEIKASYTHKERTERQIINEYIHADLLIIEEIGISFETDTEKIYLFDLLDGRYKYSNPTIIITNYNEEEFRRFIDFDGKERVWDRLQQTAVLVPFDWESYRGK